MTETKVFIVEVTEDTDINESHYEKGTRFEFNNKIPDHIQEAIDAGTAKDVSDEVDAPVGELPKVEEASAPSASENSVPSGEASGTAPADALNGVGTAPVAPEAPATTEDAPLADSANQEAPAAPEAPAA